MLLYRPDPKPLSEIAVGESFQILVTEEDWKKARAAYKPGGLLSGTCAVAQALRRVLGTNSGVTHLDANLYDPATYPNAGPIAELSHDGGGTVSDFDSGEDWPGPRIITFKREA